MAKKRNTKTKEMVKAVLSESPTALTHENIEHLLEDKIDRVTIYRILQSFEEDGLVHKIADDSGKWHYALCHHCEEGEHHDNHIHFLCNKCEAISCIDKPLEKPNLPENYSVEEVNYLIMGCCPSCQTT